MPSPRILAALFAGRLLFGLASEFWSEDETQIYLMGLRFYATGAWPYFGPDVVWTESAIAGALQPLLVGLPLFVVPIPEAPFVLLNILSFAALAALAAHICRRLPGLPRWLVWGWLMTAPWTLQFSTHVNNPSYVLPAAIVFFLGFFEAVPQLSGRLLSPAASLLMMGMAIGWIMQIHMSWPILLPFAAIALFTRAMHEATGMTDRRALPAVAARGAKAVGWLAAGAAIPGVLLLPTFLQYGLQGGSGRGLSNLHFHAVPPDRLLVTLAQVFSFASLEINRFVANDNAKRYVFLQEHAWILPVAVVVLAAGFVQPVWMLVSWFRRSLDGPEWRFLRRLVAFTVVLVYVSYWFVLEEPQAHAFYAVAPVAFIYAAYCWTAIDSPRRRRVAALVLGCNIAFHAALAWTLWPAQSVYAHRDVIAAAIRQREPEMFGHRRPYAIDAGPRALSDPARPYALSDLRIDSAAVHLAIAGAAVWDVSVTNTNPRVAFRNLVYAATYPNAEAGTAHRHDDVITRVLQPGETRTFRVVDTIVRGPFQDATFVLTAAEALVPADP